MQRILILVVLLSACGADPSLDPDAGPDADGATPDGSTFDGCDGCAPGERCVDGQCEAPSECAMTCDGCCDGAVCVAGTEGSACGAGGSSCQACGAEERCVSGVCELPCEMSCAGCCDASGLCVDGDTSAACGIGGRSCAVCDPAESCAEGVCVSSACQDTCDGCCDGDVCRGGDVGDACGSRGNACVDCGGSFTCTGGECTVDPASRWDVLAVSARVPATNPEDGAWDSLGGLPDVYVEAHASDTAGEELVDTTGSIDNDLTPFWDEVVLANVPARALLNGAFRLELWDFDLASFDDRVAVCLPTLDNRSFGSGSLEVLCPAIPAESPLGPTVDGSLVFRLRENRP